MSSESESEGEPESVPEAGGTGQPGRAGVGGDARAWVERVTGQPIVRVQRLPGATSSVVHALALACGGQLVLRRYLAPSWAEGGAELVANEVTALDAARTAPVGAPRLLAADPGGDEAGAPSLLMTRLQGRPVVWEQAGWLAALGQVHHDLAGWATDEPLPDYAPWLPLEPAVPPWTAHAAAWQRAIEIAFAAPPPSPWGPIHRDLHPGNILFRRGGLTGVVDWVNACRGPRWSDVARCRINLAVLSGIDAGDRFQHACGAVADGYDPAWDLVVAVEFLPDPSVITILQAFGAPCTPATARSALDCVVARAAAAVG